jgi:hypothetical protein
MQRSWLGFIVGSSFLVTAVSVPIVVSGQKKIVAKKTPSYATDVAPVVEKYCSGCHSGNSAFAGIKLPKGTTATQALKDPALWQRVSKNITSKHMPPADNPMPTLAQRRGVSAWVDSAFAPQDCKLADPGKVTMRRLNREEYNNTVRDLLGVTMRPADDFPSDDIGYGFDNIGDVLTMSPLLMEKYLAASEKLVRNAIRTSKAKIVSVDAASLSHSGASGPVDNYIHIGAYGTAFSIFDVKTAGWYRVRFLAGGQQAGTEPAKLQLQINNQALGTVDVSASRKDPAIYEFPVKLETGSTTIAGAFINDFYVPAKDGKGGQDRNLAIHNISLIGPTDDNIRRTDFQKALIPVNPANGTEEAAARKALDTFATRAYRRPVTPAELDRLMTIFNLSMKTGEGFDKAMQLPIQAILCNPNFLFRVELDGAPSAGANTSRTLNPYEIASRLSYFLWTSMPDSILMNLAKSGELSKPEVVNAQVARMLADPKAEALVDNFAVQWLQLKRLPLVEPDKKMFPTFSEALQNDMATETKMFFNTILREDRGIGEFIDGKFTYINGRMAQHYGIPNVTGDEFRKVNLEGTPRGGVLTQASVLTVTSNPTRTSPTKRGKWILEQILGSPPPPPPPGVGDLKDDKHFTANMTLRQKMEEHRKNPACAVCHIRMDAIGFGFENFDAIGKWRTKEGESKIDSTATLPDGKSFSGAKELKVILMGNKKEFAHNFAEKMMIYALGRGLTDVDRCALDDIVKKSAVTDYKFSSIVQGVVASEPFRKRKVEGAK